MQKQGFTLVETIVVISVVVILVTIFSSYTRTSEGQIAFLKERAILVEALTRAKSFSFGALQPSFQPSPQTPDELLLDGKVCGWGVFVTSQNQYVLFQDTIPGEVDTASCGGGNADERYTGTDENFEVFDLDPRTRIKCVYFDGGACSEGDVNYGVNFTTKQPLTLTYFDGSNTISADAIFIVLELSDGTREVTIQVDKNGLIDEL